MIKLNPKEFVPAPAQGVLAYQTKDTAIETRRVLKKIHDPNVALVTNIERRVLNLMDGGCHIPLGVYCERDDNGNYHVWGAMADNWDAPLRRVQLSSNTSHRLAEDVFEKLKP